MFKIQAAWCGRHMITANLLYILSTYTLSNNYKDPFFTAMDNETRELAIEVGIKRKIKKKLISTILLKSLPTMPSFPPLHSSFLLLPPFYSTSTTQLPIPRDNQTLSVISIFIACDINLGNTRRQARRNSCLNLRDRRRRTKKKKRR